MGVFAATVFIRNEKQLSKEQVLSEVSQYMKSQGFVQCDKNQAEKTYSFGFPEGKWFGMGSREEELVRNAKFCTQVFHSHVLTANVVDSDFVLLELYNSNGTSIDQQCIGTPYWDEEESEKEIDVTNWIPFLKEGVPEEYLIAALQANEVFAEDGFGIFGELIELDIKPLYMSWGELAPIEEINLYFKKK
ncbi:MAG: hypothetical protein K2H93_03825 [Oscillospiraceae bacterium]|nr:hypothetical protein [Oscillospiraceae bacterium]